MLYNFCFVSRTIYHQWQHYRLLICKYLIAFVCALNSRNENIKFNIINAQATKKDDNIIQRDDAVAAGGRDAGRVPPHALFSGQISNKMSIEFSEMWMCYIYVYDMTYMST